MCQEHFVPMDTLAQNRGGEPKSWDCPTRGRAAGWRQRAATGHYVASRNEPDLATLLRIAEVLQTSPNELLGFAPEAKRSKRTLSDCLNAAANAMDDRELEISSRPSGGGGGGVAARFYQGEETAA